MKFSVSSFSQNRRCNFFTDTCYANYCPNITKDINHLALLIQAKVKDSRLNGL